VEKVYAVIIGAILLTMIFAGCIAPEEHEAAADEVPPEISLIYPENNSFIRPGENIRFSIKDDNLSTATISIGNSTERSFFQPYEIDTSSWGEGTHIVCIRAEDAEGNNESAFFIFRIDLSAPAISLIFPANNSAIESSAKIRLSIEDENLLGANYTLDGGGPRILPYPYVIPVDWWSEGPHDIRVNANDRAGNRASKSYHFIIDNRPTGIVVLSPKSRVIRPGTPIIFEIDEENLVNLTCTVNGAPTDFSSYIINTTGWEDGSYYILINATDLAGHIKSVSYAFEVDSQPPVINSSVRGGSELMMNGTLDVLNYTFTHSGGEIRINADDPHILSVSYSIEGSAYTELKAPYELNLYGIRGKEANISIMATDIPGNTAYLNLTFFPRYNLTIFMPNGSSEIAVPFVLNDTYIRHVFQSVDDSYSRVLTFINGSWRSFNPAYPDKFNLDLLYVEIYMGLIVRLNNGSRSFTTDGFLPLEYTLHLRSGSNFVPYLSMRPMRLDAAFADVPWYRVQRWDSETGTYIDMKGDELLLPGHAYWVYASEMSILTVDF